MADLIDRQTATEIKKINKEFFDKLSSSMYYKSKVQGDSITFEWLDVVEDACPYLDNVVRNPKLILINDPEVEIIEKAKKITSDSVKDLARHTFYIDDYDSKSTDIRVNRILNIKSEETYNIYENRFLYTLIYFLARFIMKKEKELDELLIDRNRRLEYSGTTRIGQEEINLEFILKATDISNAGIDKKLLEEIKKVRTRIKRIKDYLSSWNRSELIKALEKEHVKLINPPIKKTNIILKNPNFQVAVNLWNFLYNYDEEEGKKKNDLNTEGNNLLTGLLDHSYLVDFYVLESVCKTKKEQKEKLNEFAFALINEEIKRLIELLRKCGFKITDDEILELIANHLGNNRGDTGDKAAIANQDIKKKFKSAMDEYLERVQEYL